MSRSITLLGFGTRGDVQPLIVLACGLQQAGWAVTLAAGREFEAEVQTRGVRYAPLRLNMREFMSTTEGRAAMNEGQAPPDSFETLVRPMLDDCWAAAQGADALIYDTMLTPAYHIAEALNIPALMTSVMPNMSPTRAFPMIGALKIGWGGWANRLSYEWYRLGWLSMYADVARWARDTLHLRIRRFENYWFLRGRRIPILYTYSPHVLPSPSDWPSEYAACGYLFLDDAARWQPPPALQAFLEAGEKPLGIGFSSMVGLDPEQLTQRVVEAVRRSGQRAILVTGWGGLVERDLPATCFVLDSVPYDWLFPRMKAVVHHGGAGTTAVGLRYGLPAVLCPFLGDQPFWGEVLAQRGLGLRPLPQKTLTTEALAATLATLLTDEPLRHRLAAVSQTLQHEDGAANAVRFIERQLA